jgi:hypothetical protein
MYVGNNDRIVETGTGTTHFGPVHELMEEVDERAIDREGERNGKM